MIRGPNLSVSCCRSDGRSGPTWKVSLLGVQPGGYAKLMFAIERMKSVILATAMFGLEQNATE